MARKQWDNRYVGGYIPKEVYETLPDEEDESSLPDTSEDVANMRLSPNSRSSAMSSIDSNSVRDAVYSSGLFPNSGSSRTSDSGTNDGALRDDRQAGNYRRYQFSMMRAVNNFGKTISKLLR